MLSHSVAAKLVQGWPGSGLQCPGGRPVRSRGRGQESLVSLCGCNKETSLRSAPVCVLSVSALRALAAWPCALLLTWPGAAPSLACQPTELSLSTAVLAESRCCLPAGARPGLPCCTCPRVARSWGQGCVLWVKSPGVLDPRAPCGALSPHWQQGPCSRGHSLPEVGILASRHRGSAAGPPSGLGSIAWVGVG